MDFIDLRAQQARIRTRIDARLRAVLDHGQYILGPEVEELEAKLAAYTGAKYCISCANGTDALAIALMALGVGRGDEVIVPAFSFFATAEAVAVVGATPVFVDIDPRTYNIDPALIEAAVTPRTKAIMPVSLFGQCADFAAINAIAARHRLPVIEDAAQSFGARQGGVRSCNLSTIGSTSFFPAKPLGCYGDGGALFTSDETLAKAMRMIARHGQSQRYRHERVGLNSRLDTLQAAVLLEKLEIFDDEVQRRAAVAAAYDQALRGCGIEPPHVVPGNDSVYAQYTLRFANRDAVAAALKAQGIPTMVYYPLPLHRQSATATAQSLPVAERACAEVLSVPMHPYLRLEDQQRIVRALVGAG
ncbi:MAG: DegT/DnrJ/EryC1/StrS family aminotransferase [Gammaproteobacteria bacterium]